MAKMAEYLGSLEIHEVYMYPVDDSFSTLNSESDRPSMSWTDGSGIDALQTEGSEL